MYRVRLSLRAREFYASAQRPLARKRARCFKRLERDPRRHPNITALKGELSGRYRFRVGDHRVVYRIDDHDQSVFVLLIAHRSQVYE